MDHKNHDKVFFKTFSMVMGALFAIFFICIVAARVIVGDPEPDAAAMARLADRIKPAALVITDPAALLKVSAPVARAPYSGEQVAAKVCNACHGTGVLGAPRSGDKLAWGERAKAVGGLTGLVASAIKGKGAAMPPRGGDPDLSDAEIKAAVEQIMKAGV